MGTDIHGTFQKKVTQDGFDSWVDVDDTWQRGRDYLLFSILAGVRNGHGFAGVVTGEEVEPISEPRGLPADMLKILPSGRWEVVDDEIDNLTEEEGCKLHRSWRGSQHSHSWLDATEMLQKWNDIKSKTYRIVQVTDRETYHRLEKDGKESKGHCSFISGKDILVIDECELQLAEVAGGIESVSNLLLSWCGQGRTVSNTGFATVTLPDGELSLKFSNVDLWGSIYSSFHYCEFEARERLKTKRRLEDYTHVRFIRRVKYEDELSYFFDEVKRLQDLHGEVRLVFGFDS